jgi:hypothetical protein
MACEDLKSKFDSAQDTVQSLATRGRTVEFQLETAKRSFSNAERDIAEGRITERTVLFINGVTFDSPSAYLAALKAQADRLQRQFDQLESDFRAAQAVRDQASDALQECELKAEKEATAAASKQNNSGTGTPGTAGEGAAASKPTTTAPAAVAVPTDPDEIAKQEALAKSTPEKLNIKTDPGVKTGQAINPETGEPYTPVPATDPAAGNTNRGLSGSTKNTRAQATLQDTTNFKQRKDWRVRLALSPGAQQAKYLYYSDTPGILAPLQATDGVIFPYTPTINVTYGANYNSVLPAHSNYKIFQYESSFVDSVSITCDFTAQDTDEANYVLAVIHFFRSVTKMFYGQDEFPKPGTPPPLCYLFGLGEFQFNAQPLAITNFTYSLPPDVDYIRAGAITAGAGVNRSPSGDPKKPKKTNPFQAVAERLAQNAVSKLGGTAQTILKKVIPGGKLAGPDFNGSQNSTGFNSTVPPGTKDPTYVPTKINISISAVPIVSRYDVSNRFSVKDYANGKLLNGVKQAGGGMW